MFCENCKASLPDDSKFCTECGTKVEAMQSAAPSPVPPAPQAAPAYNTAPPPPPAPPAYNPAYNTPPMHQAYVQQPQQNTAPLGVFQYIGIFLLMAIPILNIILLFVWSFGSSANLNKKNFARAVLIMCVISLAVWLFAWTAIAGAIGDIINNFS